MPKFVISDRTQEDLHEALGSGLERMRFREALGSGLERMRFDQGVGLDSKLLAQRHPSLLPLAEIESQAQGRNSAITSFLDLTVRSNSSKSSGLKSRPGSCPYTSVV